MPDVLHVEALDGLVVTEGAELTVSVAAVDVEEEPQPLLAIALYRYPPKPVDELIFKVAVVAVEYTPPLDIFT